jgi:hypothetical protein
MSFNGHAPRKRSISSPSDSGRVELRVRCGVSVLPSYSSTTR